MSPEARRLRFFQWNDLHVRSPLVDRRAPGYPGSTDKALWAAACARGEIAGVEPPEIIASVGDLVHGEIDDYDDDFRFFHEHVGSRLPVPLLPCVGNHENRQGEGDASLNAAYDRFFGPGWHNYLYHAGGISFLVVDTSGAHHVADEVAQRRVAFVERAFDHLGSRPVIVITHVPLVPMRQPEALAASFGFSTWKVLDEGLLQTVQSRADQVIAVLCGHIHLTGVVEHRGIYHIMPSGPGGYPSDIAAFDLFDDRLEMQMLAPPDWLTPDLPGADIHGARRHGVDYADAEHADHDSYVRGNPSERRLTIRLDGARRPMDEEDPSLVVEHLLEDGRWKRADPSR